MRDSLQTSLHKEQARIDNATSSIKDKMEQRISKIEAKFSLLEHGNITQDSKKINEMDERINKFAEQTRQSLKVMDINIIDILREKDNNLQRTINDIHSTQLSMSEQVKQLESSLKMKVDDNRLLQVIEQNFSRQKEKQLRLEQLPSFPDQTLKLENKIKDLESSFHNINLLEKDLRGKHELYDLNLSSIKRHLELDVTLTIKQSLVPIQKNVENYLQAVESRIASLEDIVGRELRNQSSELLLEKAQRPGKHSRHPSYGDIQHTNSRSASQFLPHQVHDSQNLNHRLLESHVDPKNDVFDQNHNFFTKPENKIEPNDQRFRPEKLSNLDHLHTHDSVRFDEISDEDSNTVHSNMPVVSQLRSNLVFNIQ